MSKILERILNKSLVSYLNANKVIASNQYGFRANMSTEDAVLALSQHVARSLDSKTKSLAVYLDISKAFDTVPAHLLLRKMENIGIRGHVLNIFGDYLRNRTQVIRVGKHESDEYNISYGIPQGSILGPTLFLIYVNDLCKLSLKQCEIITYADDTALVIDGRDWKECYHNAELALSSVMQWLNRNLLTLNVNKTVYTPFAIKSNLGPPLQFTVKAHTCHDMSVCNCLPVYKASEVKYLGIHIDHHLNWNKHIDVVQGRTRKLIYIFRNLRKIADRDTLNMVYLALCQSVLTYCIPVWGGAAVSAFIRLERAQRAVLKVVHFRPRRYSTSILYSEAEVLTARQLYVLHSVLRMHTGRPLFLPTSRVKYKIFPIEPHKTSFADRQFYVLGGKLYNNINKRFDIFSTNKHKCKSMLKTFLRKLDYRSTEDLLLGRLSE